MGEIASELFSSPHENKEGKCYEIEKRADGDTAEEDGSGVISTFHKNNEEKDIRIQNNETTERECSGLIINQSEELDDTGVTEDCTYYIDGLQEKSIEEDLPTNTNAEHNLPVIIDNRLQCADVILSREDKSDVPSQHERAPCSNGIETSSKCSNEPCVEAVNERITFIDKENTDGNLRVEVDDADYLPDNENLTYALQQYLKDEDCEKDAKQDMIYEDYWVISPDEVKEIENSLNANTLNADGENDEFTEIELSDLGCEVLGENDHNDLKSDTSPTPQVPCVEIEPIKENEDVTGTSETEAINPDETEVPSTIPVENEPSEVIEHPERDCIKVKPSGVYINSEKVKFVFPMNNDVYITLRYSNTSKDILGNIRSTKGLGYNEKKTCPEFIRFHVTILPQNTQRTKTKWVHASVRSLAWKFFVGPLKEDVDPTGKNIRFRLYGKSKFFFPRCYGECFVPLVEVIEAEKSVEFERNILPKGVLKNMNIKCRKRNSTLTARSKNEPDRSRRATR